MSEVRTAGAPAGRNDEEWLREAVELSRRCPPTTSAYCVGAIVVAADGTELARGYSRDTDPHVHAEESALARLANESTVDATGATIYTSMEPCSTRRSRPRTCTELIIAAGIRRVVFALREPPVFVECHGIELLQQAGVEMIELPDLAGEVRAINRQVLGGQR
jgi:diaminohydroxyphosphoribosylaminopyrimidine deaminase/5-amino-6-(5-phosphoribosylamino)uracil reductase